MAARTLLGRAAVCTALWWAIAEGDLASWPAALVAVPAAVAASVWLAPGRVGLRAGGIARFVPFFLARSLAGGLDVARRAAAPSLPLAPGFVRHELRLPPGPARVLFANAVSLLPGTVSVALGDDELEVHVLDTGLDVARSLAALEERVAGVFGL